MNSIITESRELTLDYPSWHMAVGEVLTEFCTSLAPDFDDTFDVWFNCGDLLDWISLEFPRRRYESDARVTPTEMLNADACRAFGQLAKAGFAGSAYAIAATDDATIQDTVLASSRSRDALIVTIERTGPSSWRMSARYVPGKPS